MSNVTSTTNNDFLLFSELFKKFGEKNHEYIEKILSSNAEELRRIDPDDYDDIVLSKLINVIRNKCLGYSQLYKETSLYHQVITEVDEYMNYSCDTSSILQDINTLSEMNYESSLCRGTLALNPSPSDKDSEKFKMLIQFEDNCRNIISFNKSGLRYLRKLLQITQTEDICLVLNKVNPNSWIPIGYAETQTCHLPIFTISGPLSWKFTVAKQHVTCSSGQFIVNNSVDKNIPAGLIKNLSEKLNGISEYTIETLITNVLKNKDIHGALFVFVDDEQKQVIDRLCKHKRGIKIAASIDTTLNNSKFSEEYLLNICKIDGAVVFDKNGQLLSIGTILDGKVIADGDIGRGSRYNSTKTFIEFYSQSESKWAENYKKTEVSEKDFNCIGLVISEDKYVNLIFKDEILGENLWKT